MKYKNFFLLEGGKAILSILDRLQANNPDLKLKPVEIPQQHLKIIFDKYILPILDILQKNKFIKPTYQTDFSLGSTRLASYIVGRNPKLYASETPEVLAQAIQKKQTFGDLDVDIQLEDGVSITDVGEFLQNNYPKYYAYKKINNSEISLAVVIDDGFVIQIDLVDVGNNPESIKFMQVSSILDISHSIKGYAQKMLLASVLALKKLLPDHQKSVNIFMENDPDFQKAIKNGYTPVVNSDGSIGRYSLSSNFELYVVIDMKKPGVKTIKKFKTTEKPIMKFSTINELISFIFPGQSIDSTISFIEMLKYLKEIYPSTILSEIKKKFIEKIELQKSNLSSKDIDSIIKTINQYI